ncbi:MAG: hypothetical protein ACFFCW_32595 [Candidatus Hodarchaeota archaeon]
MLVGKTTRFVVGVSLRQQNHTYVKRFDGLAFPPGGPRFTNGYRLAVPKEHYDKPWMKKFLERDGLTEVSRLRVGARIEVREKPGLFVGLVQSWPTRRERPLIDIGGVQETVVDDELIFRRRTTI